MRIVLDAEAFVTNEFSGLYSLGRGFFNGLADIDQENEIALFCSQKNRDKVLRLSQPLARSSEICSTRIKMRWLSDWWRKFPFPTLETFASKCDIYHCMHHLMPPTKAVRLMTVHDLRRYALPELYQHSKLYRFEYAVKSADHFIAVSQATKDDLCSFFDVNPERVDVVHLASDIVDQPLNEEQKAQLRQKLSRQVGIGVDKFFVVFSSSDSRKNISRIVQGFFKAGKQLPEGMKLVVLGQLPRRSREIREKIPELENRGVVFPGPVRDTGDWLRCSEGLVFTSLYEGFGIPVVEAFNCGVPVITSNISSMPEVAGEAGLQVNPYDTDGIANAMISICSDNQLRQEMIDAGLQRAKLYSWEKMASQTLDVYSKLIG